MADPLSLTLAAVTLATALKDIVELAQMIQESCEKVSWNRHELQSLASEIKTTVLQLKKFGDDHHDILCDAEDMKVSLLGLINDMRVIHDKCRQMFPPFPPKKLEKLKIAFSAWMNRNIMEEDIKDLRNRVNKYHSQFVMFAVLRIESHLVVIRQQKIPELIQSRQEIASVGASDDKLVAFMGSTLRVSSQLSPEIAADFLTDTYICLQIDVIDRMLNHLNQLSSTGSFHLFLFLPQPSHQPSIELPSLYDDKTSVRQQLICQLLEIQRHHRSDFNTCSIRADAMARILDSIALLLEALKLHKEASTAAKLIGKVLYSVAKTNQGISKTEPQIYLPRLGGDSSSMYFNVFDVDGSLCAIKEEIKANRILQPFTTYIESEFRFAAFLIDLLHDLDLYNQKEESLKAVQEALDILDNAITKNREQPSHMHGVPCHSSNSPWASFFEGISDVVVSIYARALGQLTFSLLRLGYPEDALYTATEALDVTTFLTQVQTADILLRADMLLLLSHEFCHEFITIDETLSFSEQAVALLEAHFVSLEEVKNYGIALCAALCRHAKNLERIQRHDEAFALCQQAIKLVDGIVADQLLHGGVLGELSWTLRRLKRYDEAVFIRTKCINLKLCSEYYSRNKTKAGDEADSYYQLGVELRLSRRWPEATKAFQVALTQYRALAFNDPEPYTGCIGRTLNQLTTNFIDCKEFGQAFDEGHTSLQLHQSLLEDDAHVLDEYILAVSLNCYVAELAGNEDKCVERARYNIMCARHIARKHPSKGGPLLSAIIRRSAMILFSFDRLSEAEIVIQESLEWHEQNPSQDEYYVEHYMRCLITTCAIAHNQGYLNKAAQYLQKTINMGKRHSSYKSVCSALVHSMRHQIYILCAIGLYAEAAEAGEECFAFACRNPKNSQGTDVTMCLRATAMAFQYDGKLDDAIVYINEALRLFRKAKITGPNAYSHVLRWEAESLACLSEILADTGKEVQALVEAKAAVEKALELKLKSKDAPSYIHTLKTYSLRLAASGDLSGALDQLVQVRSNYESGKNVCLSLLLGPVLYVEGILCCAAGQHGDGAAAVAKLRNLQKHLRIVFPELAQNVEVHLKRQRTSPSMIALIKKLDLKCDHEH